MNRETAQGDKVRKFPSTQDARDLAAEVFQQLTELYDLAETFKTRQDKLAAKPKADASRFPVLGGE